MKIPDKIWLPGQAILAVAESVWKRVLDQVLGLILLAGAGLALILGWSMELQGGEFRMALILLQIFVSLLVIFIGTTEIPRDLATRNIQFFLSKPLGRGGYIAGKFAGVLILGELILLGYVACFEAGAAINGLWNLKELSIDLVRMTLQMAALSALAVSLSVVLPEVAATIFGVAFYIASYLIFILPPMARLLAPGCFHPVFLCLYYLIPNNQHYLWDGSGVRMGYFLFLLMMYSIAYGSFVLMLADLWFRRRDLN